MDNTYKSSTSEKLTNLKLDNILSIAIIIVSFINIFGDLIEQQGVINNDSNKKELSHDIYTFAVICSIILYLIFFARSKNALDKAINNNEDTFLQNIRLLGSIFFILGILCIFYFTINDNENIDSPEI
ncbi:MAG: oligosaccharide flippase family protein [Bacilli bacterium]|nr:oligosaccharide flippase family protein [Bacilli bacterium]